MEERKDVASFITGDAASTWGSLVRRASLPDNAACAGLAAGIAQAHTRTKTSDRCDGVYVCVCVCVCWWWMFV